MFDFFKIGDYVWAKKKCFCPLPAKIVDPVPGIDPEENVEGFYVYFYGIKKYDWIPTKYMKPYAEYKDKVSIKSTIFKKAVAEINKVITDTILSVKRSSEDKDDTISAKKICPIPDLSESEPSETENDKLDDISEQEDKTNEEVTDKVGSIPTNDVETEDVLKEKETIESEDVNNVADETIDIPLKYRIDFDKMVDREYATASTLTFGFLGLGNIGFGIVKNLIISGHSVNLWNRTIKKAIYIKIQAEKRFPGKVDICQTVTELIDKCDVIIVCVDSSHTVEQIFKGDEGALINMELLDGKGYIEMTSVDSASSLKMYETISSMNGSYLEAQLQGSRDEANDASLVIVTSGDIALYRMCNTCFKAIGKTAYYMGPTVGLASKMNTILQVIKGVTLCGLSESFALADRAGIAPDAFIECLAKNDLSSPHLLSKAKMMEKTDFLQVQQSLLHMHKDMRLALQLAENEGFTMFMLAAANEIFTHARQQYLDNYDCASIFLRSLNFKK